MMQHGSYVQRRLIVHDGELHNVWIYRLEIKKQYRIFLVQSICAKQSPCIPVTYLMWIDRLCEVKDVFFFF